MAAADITINNQIATIECDATVKKLIIEATSGSLANIGSDTVFLDEIDPNGVGNLFRDNLQHIGEIPLAAGSSIPVKGGGAKYRRQCAAAKTTTLIWVPNTT